MRAKISFCCFSETVSGLVSGQTTFYSAHGAGFSPFWDICLIKRGTIVASGLPLPVSRNRRLRTFRISYVGKITVTYIRESGVLLFETVYFHLFLDSLFFITECF